jgi:hypothetical protein
VSAAVTLEFTDPTGEPLRIEWDADALARLAPEASAKPAWTLGGELDWDEVEALRVLSGRLDDGALVAIAALRPTGAAGHGEELVAGALGEAEALDRLAEALLSTEYGAEGLPRRVGAEVYRSDDGLAVRIAGDATSSSTDVAGGVRRQTTALTLRCAGAGGVGVLDVMTRA